MGWGNVRTETEKVNKLLFYIEMDNINQLGYWTRKNKSQKLITKKKARTEECKCQTTIGKRDKSDELKTFTENGNDEKSMRKYCNKVKEDELNTYRIQ